MSKCPVCGRYDAPCPETGYDGEDVCPDCVDEGWDTVSGGAVINVHDDDDAVVAASDQGRGSP